mmetsp:Transcript_103174/g.321537  ORF Transcript_103174/g.321537 Transcript_103174/m.321537 type:complete len:364 (+) Transcript_103174:711-1802(+)
MLLLALRRGLPHLLVQLLDPPAQRVDLLRERGDLPLDLLDGLPHVRDVQAHVFELVVGLPELGLAVVPLLVVVGLLLNQESNHVIDHLDHFEEAGLLGAQGHRHEVQAGAAPPAPSAPRRLDCPESLLPRIALLGRPELQERWRGQGLLEEGQRLVVVQDFDRLSDRLKLLAAHLLPRRPLGPLGLAARLHVGQELPVLLERLRGVVKVCLKVNDVDRELAQAGGLRLHLPLEGADLVGLGLDHVRRLVLRHCVLLLDLKQPGLHLLLHLLQDAQDLAVVGLVALALPLRQEGGDRVAVAGAHVQGEGQLAQRAGRRGLQELAGAALLQGQDGLAQGVEVALRVGHLFHRGLVLLLRDLLVLS